MTCLAELCGKGLSPMRCQGSEKGLVGAVLCPPRGCGKGRAALPAGTDPQCPWLPGVTLTFGSWFNPMEAGA